MFINRIFFLLPIYLLLKLLFFAWGGVCNLEGSDNRFQISLIEIINNERIEKEVFIVGIFFWCKKSPENLFLDLISWSSGHTTIILIESKKLKCNFF